MRASDLPKMRFRRAFLAELSFVPESDMAPDGYSLSHDAHGRLVVIEMPAHDWRKARAFNPIVVTDRLDQAAMQCRS
jgi:hypothetical protein